ncbi:Phosphoribosylformylglycinamidine synthase subunit PurL [Dissostichus eleginoides]|uniref:Phosphoribosylformylglycinamidine synthase subunit PurL n=1 Tax=Dissostichus eleginoides TaxID=100907 RepID=A0AAD9EU10_DISEL|nr:Phosphoribosylformylglycinamidine synthase subunit PurL [Dissostichus eleginoides]
MESLPARPSSAPPPTGHIHRDIWSIASPICASEELNHEEATQQNTPPACGYQQHNVTSSLWPSGVSHTEGRQEGDYDILPLRNRPCGNAMEEGVYDLPMSYRRAAEHPNPAESIYDVPSSLLRRRPDHTLVAEVQPEDGDYWRI